MLADAEPGMEIDGVSSGCRLSFGRGIFTYESSPEVVSELSE